MKEQKIEEQIEKMKSKEKTKVKKRRYRDRRETNQIVKFGRKLILVE